MGVTGAGQGRRGGTAGVLLTIAGTLGAPAAAFAQTSQTFDDRLFRLPNFPMDRQLAVDQRRPDGYAAVPFRVGPVDVMPAISVIPTYTDNVYATKTDKVDDLIANGRARVDVAYATPVLAVTVAGLLDARAYQSRRRESTVDWEVGGTAKIAATSLSGFEVGGAQARNTLERFAPNALDQVARPVRFRTTDGFALYGLQVNRLRLVGRVADRYYDYDDAPRNGGGIVDQDFRDHNELSASANAEYAISPDIALLVTALGNWRRFRDDDNRIEPQRDSNGTELAAGARVRLGPALVGDVRIGRLEQHFRNPIYADIDTLLVRARLDYQVTRLISLRGTIDRDVQDSGLFRSGSVLITTANLGASYELLRTLTISADVSYNRDRFNGIDRKDNRVIVGLGARHLLSPRVVLQADYRYRLRDSAGLNAGREFRTNVLSFGITFRGL